MFNAVNKLAALITVIEVVVLVEELVRFRGIKTRFPQGRELALVLLGVAIETVGWILPLVSNTRLLVAFGILFVTLDIEHAVINLATTGKFSLGSVVDFSAIEAAGGALWLTNPSAATIAILVVTSVLEHVQGVRQGMGLR